MKKPQSIDYRALLKNTTLSDRVNIIKTDQGRQLMKALTPTEVAKLFPDYYLKNNAQVQKLASSSSALSTTASGTTRKVGGYNQRATTAAQGAAPMPSGSRTATPTVAPTSTRPGIARNTNPDATKFTPTPSASGRSGTLSMKGVEKILRITSEGETGLGGREKQKQAVPDAGGWSFGLLGLHRGPAGDSVGQFSARYPNLGLGPKPSKADWQAAVARDPDGMYKAQLEYYKTEYIDKVTGKLIKGGVNPKIANDPRVIAYFTDRKIQMEDVGYREVVSKNAGAKTSEEFLKGVTTFDNDPTNLSRFFRRALSTGTANMAGLQRRVDLRNRKSLGLQIDNDDIVSDKPTATAVRANKDNTSKMSGGIDTSGMFSANQTIPSGSKAATVAGSSPNATASTAREQGGAGEPPSLAEAEILQNQINRTSSYPLSSTATSQGVETALSRMHPAYLKRAEQAQKALEAAGFRGSHIWSAYRRPEDNVNTKPGSDWSKRSIHGFGAASDWGGVPRFGTPEYEKWADIMEANGFINPYRHSKNPEMRRKEFNHWQITPATQFGKDTEAYKLREEWRKGGYKDDDLKRRMWEATGVAIPREETGKEKKKSDISIKPTIGEPGAPPPPPKPTYRTTIDPNSRLGQALNPDGSMGMMARTFAPGNRDFQQLPPIIQQELLAGKPAHQVYTDHQDLLSDEQRAGALKNGIKIEKVEQPSPTASKGPEGKTISAMDQPTNVEKPSTNNYDLDEIKVETDGPKTKSDIPVAPTPGEPGYKASVKATESVKSDPGPTIADDEEKAPVDAAGGRHRVDGKLTAYPIKKSLKAGNENTALVDTANGKMVAAVNDKEKLNFNPRDKSMTVTPEHRAHIPDSAMRSMGNNTAVPPQYSQPQPQATQATQQNYKPDRSFIESIVPTDYIGNSSQGRLAKQYHNLYGDHWEHGATAIPAWKV